MDDRPALDLTDEQQKETDAVMLTLTRSRRSQRSASWACLAVAASLLAASCSHSDDGASTSLPPPRVSDTSPHSQSTLAPASDPPTTPHEQPTETSGPGAPPDATFEYADAIRERVFVTNGRDEDSNGHADQFSVDIVRPDTPRPVPVIMVQSPYWDNGGRGREHEPRERNRDGVMTSMPLFYDNWFVPRGYAVVALDAPEYGDAGGCDDNFGPASTASTMAALDWLSGAGPAVNRGGHEQLATWSDGNVAMIGKSADGALAIDAAATGHPALKAIVPIEGVTSLQDRATAGGLLAATVPTSDWFEFDPECARFGEQFISDWGDGFHYTDFWRQRDPTADMSHYTAATFIVDGFADLNVDTRQAKLLWDALRKRGVPRKMWLHQSGHQDPFEVRRDEWVTALSRFFDHYLLGVDNGIDVEPMVTVQNSDGTWTDLDDWPPSAQTDAWIWQAGALQPAGTDPAAPTESVPLGAVARDVGDVAAPTEGFIDFWLGDLASDRPYRATLMSDALTEPLLIRGEPTITASFRMTGARYGVAATLLDLGPGQRIDPEDAVFGSDLADIGTQSCWGGSTSTDDSCYQDAVPALAPTEFGIVGTGGTGIERRTFRDELTPVPDGEWTSATIGLGMANLTVPAGHRIAIVFTASSLVFVDQPSTRTVEIGSDLRLTLPVSG